ncbi:MAG: hypothetical protein NVV82_25955 [Sporocytophaga sp.]|nr:hypothetical protein [Sporocytophaga sp.]
MYRLIGEYLFLVSNPLLYPFRVQSITLKKELVELIEACDRNAIGFKLLVKKMIVVYLNFCDQGMTTKVYVDKLL